MQHLLRNVVVGLLWVAGAASCRIGTQYEDVVVPGRIKTQKLTCNSPFVKPDAGQLKACGSAEKGKGHCYDPAKVPVDRAELEPCDDGKVCVPDKLLFAGGTKAKSCTFFYNQKPGVCISILMKSAFQNKDLMQRDTCDEDERCAPCVDPRDGKDTGICDDTGVHEGDCVGGAAELAPSCCHLSGICIAESGVDEEARSYMKADTCPAGLLCAPASQVEQRPVKCDLFGASGVCLDVCFAAQLRGTSMLTRTSCGPTEVCVPCGFASVMGGSQGMLGCD